MSKKLLIALLFFILSCITVSAQTVDTTKVFKNWENYGTGAYISVNVPGSLSRTFIVSFDIESECASDFSFAALEGSGYGRLIGQSTLPKGTLKILVDDKVIFDTAVMVAQYSNGYDYMGRLTKSMKNMITKGNLLKIILTNDPSSEPINYLFSLNGSQKTINNALSTCNQIANK